MWEDVWSKGDSSAEGGGLVVLCPHYCIEVSTNNVGYGGEVREGIPEGSLALIMVVSWGIDIAYVNLC